MDQSEFEANTCNRCQARENACQRGTVGFGFVSHWLIEKVARVWLNQSRSVVKQNRKQTRNYFRHSIENRSMINAIGADFMLVPRFRKNGIWKESTDSDSIDWNSK